MTEANRNTWSFRLLRAAGIDVRVHLTFFLLLLWVSLSVWQHSGSGRAVLQGLTFVLSLFTCVVLHEFGHALTARRFGIRTRRITLLPIGGVASMERMPDDPRQEILVALAGPAVNLVIAAVLWLVLAGSGFDADALARDPMLLFQSADAFFYNLMVINLVLAIFNLLPAFPMDGGRVLRASLALFIPHHEATRRAAAIGQTLALGLFVLGLLYNPLLMLISVFIWLGAAGEAGAETLSHALHDVSAADVMLTRLDTLTRNQTLAQALDTTLHDGQRFLPVAGTDGQWHVLGQEQLLDALRHSGEGGSLSTLNLPPLPLEAAHTPADTLFRRMQSGDTRVIGIHSSGELVGLVTLESLTRYIQLHDYHGRHTG